jgi:hypothetical protein
MMGGSFGTASVRNQTVMDCRLAMTGAASR